MEVTGSVPPRAWRLATAILRPEALQAGPGLDQCAVQRGLYLDTPRAARPGANCDRRGPRGRHARRRSDRDGADRTGPWTSRVDRARYARRSAPCHRPATPGEPAEKTVVTV